VIRRGTANRAVKAAAKFGRDNLKTNGSEIDTDVLIAIVVCLTIRLRKFGATRPAAFRASESFGPLIASGHPSNMRLQRTGSSQYPCHKQTDPLPAFGVRDRSLSAPGENQHAMTFPTVGNCFIENSANQVDGNSLSVALSKRFSLPRPADK
jgi:hypothetical protein